MSAITYWKRYFDPGGADWSFFKKTDKRLIERFLSDAGYSMQEGMKHAREIYEPILGECWVFPTTIVFLDDKPLS